MINNCMCCNMEWFPLLSSRIMNYCLFETLFEPWVFHYYSKLVLYVFVCCKLYNLRKRCTRKRCCITNSVIDMYVKCGLMHVAHILLDKLCILN